MAKLQKHIFRVEVIVESELDSSQLTETFGEAMRAATLSCGGRTVLLVTKMQDSIWYSGPIGVSS